MAPKFRGGSEDWLDEADRTQEKAKTRPKKGNVARSTDLQIEDTNAGVVEVFPNQCRVQMDDHSFLLCHYRRAEVVSKGQDGVRERTPVAVGDRVWVNSVSPSEGRVEGIAVRKNRISRPAPGRDGKKWQHVIAANIDLLVIVASAQEPPFSPGLVDRFSIGALVEKIPVLLCVAKTDLVGPTDPRPWQAYREIGYSLVETSVQGNVGVDSLKQEIAGKSVAFCGQSGVGKTSLLRTLLGTEIGRVGKVNETTGKGKHTTTSAVLLNGPENSRWIDTPGVREFGLNQLLPEALVRYFPEFQQAPCIQKGCLHIEEEGCAVRETFRYGSYRRIFESLKNGEN